MHLVSWRCLGCGRLEDQLLAMLRGQLADIVFGAVFLFIGLAACSIAAIRPRSGVHLLIWLAIWSAMYGTGLLSRSPDVVAALPLARQTSVPLREHSDREAGCRRSVEDARPRTGLVETLAGAVRPRSALPAR